MEGYRAPDFNVVLFDQSELTLSQEQRIELAWALTSLARNFPDDASITPRAKAMALLLSHHFLPFNRDTVVGNFHLRHGLATRPTGHYEKKEEIVARIEAIVAGEALDEPDLRLRGLLVDVLDEVLDRDSESAPSWNGAVPPKLRPLKQRTARVQFFDRAGRLLTLTASAIPLSEEGAFAVMQGRRRTILTPSFHEDLAMLHPFVAKHLEMTLPGMTLVSSSLKHKDFLVRLLIEQMVDGWAWNLKTALCGVGEGLSAERSFAQLDASFERTHTMTTILMPPQSPVAFRDWMAFDQLDRLISIELIAADSVQEVVTWHSEGADRDQARALFSRCVPMMGKRIISPEKISLNSRLSTWLAQIEETIPSHLSTTVLRKYGTLAKPPRATLSASLAWLEKQAGKVMGVDARGHDRTFGERVCAPLLKTLGKVDARLDMRTREFARALARYVDHHSVPFSRVTNRGTKTSRRQYSKLTGAQADWRRMKRRLENELSVTR